MIEKFNIELIIAKLKEIRKIFISLLATIICVWAFFRNNLFAKVIISPFIICSISMFVENIFLLFNKEKISNIFKYIFCISFFTYMFGFISYAFYYSIVNKSYDLIIVILIFLIFGIYFFKKAFFTKNKDDKEETQESIK